ncbi:hypothetical protein ANCCEY_14411 [Ancylostoma ceylanicum]|uniref:Protein kinase domain-containing protein n=1 Tax=Ancylostoma ceylanicum TaxID=53326 RepID=A0A0D6L6M1_9BILA|nr:hypothetical protein ANCCEY_14411 [Ancylostoma ceylanicum]
MFMLLYPIRQQSWEYYHSDIQLGNVLGEGAFGMVRAGTLKTKSGKAVPVAIKQILGGKCLRFPSSCPEKLREFFASRVFAMVPSHRATMTEVSAMMSEEFYNEGFI